MGQYYSGPIGDLARHASAERTFITRSADLRGDPAGWWRRFVEAFNRATGGAAPQFRLGVYRDIERFRGIEINANDERGWRAVSSRSGRPNPKGTYKASNYQPMRNATAAYIMKCWEEDCRWLVRHGIDLSCAA
uniref:Uncharacterized protein n=1 Tax=Phaeomonas parva TaxID=124430 RepID=A0A7S1XWY5_9STRA|mmetsp:Transcript_40210/g.125808  ORF Transcript_40210/g.125808 Transcript_40210/m.125808 type:complete len:134 (+) Transcript_40210:83-484(+)